MKSLSPSVLAATDEERWQAVAQRSTDPALVGSFVYAVVTTGVYCRCDCPSRRPLRRNVRFFALPAEAAAAGFRPCKRCLGKTAEATT